MADFIEVVLVFGPDGSVSAGIEGGVDPEQADAALKRFFAALKVDSLPVVQLSEPERHVHNVPRFLTRTSDRA